MEKTDETKTFRLDSKLLKAFMATVQLRGEKYKHVLEKLMAKYIKEEK